MRLVIGDALHSLADLGSGGLRLDANGFLGVEKTRRGQPRLVGGPPAVRGRQPPDRAAWSARSAASPSRSSTSPSTTSAMTGEAGADLSYDFINRPAYHHALATADTEFLRLTLRTSARARRRPRLAGPRAAEPRRADLRARALVDRATATTSSPTRARRSPARTLGEISPRRPHRAAHRARTRPTTWSSPPTASPARRRPSSPPTLGVHRPRHRSTTIDRASGAPTCCWRCSTRCSPGVFALSGWDLCGMLTLPADEVADLLEGGDTRWIHRAAHDLMGVDPARDASPMAGMPRGRSLYGSAPRAARRRDQLRPPAAGDPRACARHYGIATSTQVDIPDVSHRGMLVMVHQLDEPGQLQLTVLNFAGRAHRGHRPLRAPAARRLGVRHVHRRADRHGRRPAQLRRRTRRPPRHVAAGAPARC